MKAKSNCCDDPDCPCPESYEDCHCNNLDPIPVPDLLRAKEFLIYELERLRADVKRKDAQISEALSILSNGTEWEKRHVPAILKNAL